MSLNIGSLVGYLELDDKRFNRSAAAADKKMTALQLHLKALAATNPKIQVTVDTETKKLDELKAKLADLKAQAAKGVDVRVEIAQAMIEIDRVQLKLRELHDREVKVKVDADTDSALAKVGALGSKISGLWTMVLGLGPMLLPVAGAATGGLLAIGSASVSAAAGVGVLVAAFTGLSKATSALSTYREAVQQAGPKAQIQAQQLALGVATAQKAVNQAGPKSQLQAQQLALGVASAQKAYAKHPTAANAQKLAIARQKQALGPSTSLSLAEQRLAIAKAKQARGPQALISAQNTLEKSAYGDQTAAGKSFVRFILDKLQPAAHELKASAQSTVLPGVEKGLDSLLKRLPLFNRIVISVGTALGTMAARAGKALADPFWRQFFQWIAATAGPNLLLMGHTFGQFFEGISRVLERFGPQGHSLVQWVDTLATKFNAWTQGGAGSGFQRFLDYVNQSGPAVEAVLKPIASIIVNLLAGMSTTGMGELHVLGILLDGIAHLPVGAIQTIGTVLPVIVLALKGMQFVSALAAGINTLAGSFGNLARNAEGAASTGALGGGKTMGRVGGVVAGVTIASSASSIHNKAGQYAANIGGGALTGASAGALIGSIVPGLGTAAGAAIGGTLGGLAGLYRQLHMVSAATKTSAGSWKDYAGTLDGVTAHATRATRALAYQRLQASGMLDSTRKLGLSDRTVVQAVTGNPKARQQLATALSDEQRFHAAGLSASDIQKIYDETGALGKAQLAQLQMNLAIAQGKDQIAQAKKALDDFVATNGTAKVGLTGYQQTMQQLKSIKGALNDVWGKSPGANTQPGGIGSLLGVTTSGGSGPLLPIPMHKAHGGKVRAGHLYNVAEGGRFELFIPGTAGEIVSNHNAKHMLASRGSGIDMDRLERLVASMRPLYGDTYMQPHNYNEFLRQRNEDVRLAGIGGVPS